MKAQPLFGFVFMSVHPGTSPSLRPGDGSEDEQAEQQPSQHAEGGPAHEPALPPQHPQVGGWQTLIWRCVTVR